MRFQRGQSGNPGGRPAMPAKMRDALQALSEKALTCLGELLDHRDGRIRLRAAERILDRAWGRPAIAVDLIASEGTPLAELPDSALEKLIAQIERLSASTDVHKDATCKQIDAAIAVQACAQG